MSSHVLGAWLDLTARSSRPTIDVMRWGMTLGVAVAAWIAGCGPGAPPRGVRQADIDAWQEVPVIELETHPLFSTVPLTKRRLSDGSEMWDYVSCRSYQEDMNCLSGRGAFGTINTNCSGGGTRTNCCHNQFMVRTGVVESYHPRGSCYTDCSKRPGASCDAPDAVRVSVHTAEEAVSGDPAVVAIRHFPKVPEIGATLAEGRALCVQQRGEFVNPSASFGCRIRKDILFACTIDAESRADRCDGYYEAADLTANRQAVEAKLGPPIKETLSTEGFRIFEWANGVETVMVTMYARGVRITHSKRSPESAAAP